MMLFFFFQAEDGIRDHCVTGVQTCALPILFDPIISVCPSAGALSSACAPTMPAAPGRFSITIGWPSASPSAGATVRAVISTLPPGTKGTISRIGLLGKPCAPAAHAPSAARALASLTRLLAVIFLLLVFLGRRLLAVGFLLLVGLLLRRRFFRRGLLLVLFRIGFLRLCLLVLGRL